MNFVNEKIEQIVDEIISEETGIFDCIYREFLSNFLAKLVTLMITNKSLSKVEYDIESCLREIGNTIRTDLIEICQRTLISDIYNCREELKGKDEFEKYELFCKQYMQNKYKIEFNETKAIYSIIQTKLDNRYESIREFIFRISNDIELICKKFSICSRIVNKIAIGEGDTHNGGRSVFIIEFSSGDKVVYKPHSLANDELFNGFIEQLNKFNEIKYHLSTIDIINCGEYGWQEFIEARECLNESEIQQYMYRFGMIVAIAYVFGSTDFHFENIIAHAGELYIIDLETLFFNNTMFGKDMNKVEDGLAKVLRHSIFNSALLPSNFMFSTAENSLDLSGLMGGYEQMIYQTQVVVNRKRADIHFEKCNINVTDGMKSSNIVRLKGENVKVIDYVEFVVEGFKKCYESILNNRGKFLRLFSGTYWKNGKYRQVLRQTQLYWKYLQASTHPYYIGKQDERKIVFSKLCSSKCSELQCELAKLEEEQLMQFEIPFFYTTYESLDLYTTYGGKIKNFYDKSIKDIVLDNINNLSLEDMNRQIYFIKCSLMKKLDLLEVNSVVHIDIDNNLSARGNQLVTKILDKLLDFYMITDQKNEYNNMFTMYENATKGYSLDVLHFGMYYGGGVANLLLHMYAKVKNMRYYDTAMGMIRSYNKKMQNIDELDIGAFSGIGSLLWMNYSAYLYTKKETFKKSCLRILDYLLEREERSDSIDLMSGYAGIVVLCSKIFDDGFSTKAFLVLEKYLNKLVKRLDVKQALTGFAHGLSGISVALIIVSKYFGEKYYNLGMQCIIEEDKYYDETCLNWRDKRNIDKEPKAYWCYGATGILAARLIVKEYVGRDDEEIILSDINKAMLCVINQKFTGKNMNYNLCHGILGNLDVLLRYLDKFPENQCVEEYIEKQVETLLRSIKEGIYVSEIPFDIVTPDFMTGIMGVPYLLLRYYDRSVKSILQLEL